MKIRLTLQEAERLAYIKGDARLAALFADVLDKYDEDEDDGAILFLSEVYYELG